MSRPFGDSARVVFHLRDETGRYNGIDAELDRRLELYTAIGPTILGAIGGDRFPTAAAHPVS
jgi:hypothetical protein